MKKIVNFHCFPIFLNFCEKKIREKKTNLNLKPKNKLKEIKKEKVKSDHEIEIERYNQQRKLEREASIKKEREKKNTIKFEVVSPLRKDPLRGMRFITNFEPINRGRLGHSKTFLKDV